MTNINNDVILEDAIFGSIIRNNIDYYKVCKFAKSIDDKNAKNIYVNLMQAIRRYKGIYYDVHGVKVKSCINYLLYKYLCAYHADDLNPIDKEQMDKAFENYYGDLEKAIDFNGIIGESAFEYATITDKEEILDLNFTIRVCRTELAWNKFSLFLYLLDNFIITYKADNVKDIINHAAKIAICVDKILQFDKCMDKHVFSNGQPMGVLFNREISHCVALYFYNEMATTKGFRLDENENILLYQLFKDTALRMMEYSTFECVVRDSKDMKSLNELPIMFDAEYSAISDDKFSGLVTDDDIHNFIFDFTADFRAICNYPVTPKLGHRSYILYEFIQKYAHLYSSHILPAISDKIENAEDLEYLKTMDKKSPIHKYLSKLKIFAMETEDIIFNAIMGLFLGNQTIDSIAKKLGL